MTGGLVRSLYTILVARDWVRPGEFWTLAPGEVWWLIEARSQEAGPPIDRDEMRLLIDEARAEEARAKRTGRAPDYTGILGD